MNRDQIIANLYTGKNFNSCIAKMEPEHLREELKSEVIAVVCEWPEEKVIGLYERGELDFYVVRVILNQVQSNSSPFFKKFRLSSIQYEGFQGDGGTMFDGHMNAFQNGDALNLALVKDRNNLSANAKLLKTPVEEIEDRKNKEDLEDLALGEIENLYWYDAGLMRLYIEHGNFRAIQKATGIPFVSCYKNIQKSISVIRDRILQHNETQVA